MRAAFPLVVACALAAACSRQGPPLAVQVGAHAVSVRLPAEWEVREEPGSVVLFAVPAGKSQATAMTVTLRDMGPVTPAAYRRELAGIAGLWADRKADGAVSRLRTLRWPSELFPSLARNAEFTEAWTAIARAPAATAFADVKADFETVDRILDATQPLAAAAVASWALAHLDSGARREVAARRKVSVAGRDAEEVETRDTLAQGLPRRILLVPNEGRLLLLTTGIVGRDAEIGRYEAIRDSIKLPAAR